MFILRFLMAVLTSRILWTLIGLALLSGIIWIVGPIVRVGPFVPLAPETVRLGVIAALVILWLIWMIVAQRRAIRANRLFVAEIAAPVAEAKLSPGEENVAAVGAKFQGIMAELKRRKLGGRKFLREMPWYVIVGPPGTGKTTALRQSGLNFPIDLTDDLHGVGGTRNCDWFFTESAVLVDTAGRYVQQESQPDVDATEWLGFLDLLKKHRGRRALNGVIVALSIDVLLEGDAAVKAHGRKIRRRLAELNERLEIRLPVYLMLTKADLLRGFEPFFGGLSASAREQVWGTTFPLEAKLDPTLVGRELSMLARELERRLVPLLENEEKLGTRAEIFRFPGQVEGLSGPVQLLVETIFGETRYEDSAWLRGLYLTSATQEGAPIDRLTAALTSAFGLPARRSMPASRIEKRSFFLKNLLTEVIFKEAGLGTFDPRAVWRRVWIWRGAGAACAAAFLIAVGLFGLSYYDNRQAIAAQASQLVALQTPLSAIAATRASLDPSDIGAALDVMDAVAAARTPPPSALRDLAGPSAAPELLRAQTDTYDHALRNVLEPRMVALMEATMWRQIRDPDFMFSALKAYRMMTGLSQMDPDFVQDWWMNTLPGIAAAPPFTTPDAEEHEVAAIRRMAVDDSYSKPDNALVAEALKTVCTVPLSVRAYKQLLSDEEVKSAKEWIPANFAGPNGAKVLSRRSDKTLRIGIAGAYTYDGFHNGILDRLQDVAAQAALDRAVFAGGCSDSAETSVEALSQDILKLYYDDYIAQWDSFLHDVRLAPLTDLNVASENLKDLSSADSAVKRLVTAVVAETELTRSDDAPVDPKAAGQGASKLLNKLGKIGKLATTGMKLLPRAGSADQVDETGSLVAEHYKPLKGAIVETDGLPPALDAAVVALTALSNVLQTVTASPDPQEAIKKQGGLAELTGAVARQAQILPNPLNEWLGGIAGDTSGLTEKAVTSELNAIWRADVLPFCQAALADRYPFSPNSAVDVNVRDFARLFGPGGLIDAFTNNQLIAYVDTTQSPWKWRQDFGLDSAALPALEQARHIRDDLFAGGQGPMMSFTLEPKDLSSNATRVALNLDGQSLVYYNNATRPQPMTWPGKDGTGVISLSFQPIDGSPEVMVNETGSWAWLRLLRTGRFTATSLTDVYDLRLGFQGFYADYRLKAESVENPYNLEMFKKFTCPPQL
ncbi:type VI secretion system membrane subunit TssM [Mesorhizobium sp. BR1-1-16]|uniref:type VI secretion system membrane subunit TssM n=1 Tax=Mesorhizobium sp. BR1-1-16 TaxID=2876653 RepID=UPI001CCFDD0D|nr:type VI secretion system membrane subunit TssM [Mesorhizobium sp. BR1-1-16]MBZ9936339.1 type VI secretion system membrane subunit TssM [Mesorhizobium sp. BR1-1-16]